MREALHQLLGKLWPKESIASKDAYVEALLFRFGRRPAESLDAALRACHSRETRWLPPIESIAAEVRAQIQSEPQPEDGPLSNDRPVTEAERKAYLAEIRRRLSRLGTITKVEPVKEEIPF